MHFKNQIGLFFISTLLAAQLCAASDTNLTTQHMDRNSPPLLGFDLSSNQNNAIPFGHLQLITYYDGADQATLKIEVLRESDWHASWIQVSTSGFGIEIGTFEFDLSGYQPSGRFKIDGVVENGAVDGLAYAWLWRDDQGHYKTYRSVATQPTTDARVVGVWPLLQNLYGENFENVTPHVSSNFGRGQARALILGAELLPNGKYSDCD